MDLLQTKNALLALLERKDGLIQEMRETWTPNCYCEEGQDFCGGYCDCGMPAHTQHFPGPVPYTGGWCTRCAIDLAMMAAEHPAVDQSIFGVGSFVSLYEFIAVERREAEGLPDASGATPEERSYVQGSDAWLENERRLGRLDEAEHLELVLGLTTDAGLAHLRGLTNLRTLSVISDLLTDEGLAHLSNLTTLSMLDIQAPHITDDGIAHLSQLKNLRNLSLNHSGITDAGLVHLSQLSLLKRLYLDGTKIQGDGFVHLQGLTELKSVSLVDTPITDEAFQILGALVSLKSITLMEMRWDECAGLPLGHRGPHPTLTSSGVERLRRALPNCSIDDNEPSEVDLHDHDAN